MDGRQHQKKKKKKQKNQKQHSTNIDFVQQKNAELYLLVVGQKKKAVVAQYNQVKIRKIKLKREGKYV